MPSLFFCHRARRETVARRRAILLYTCLDLTNGKGLFVFRHKVKLAFSNGIVALYDKIALFSEQVGGIGFTPSTGAEWQRERRVIPCGVLLFFVSSVSPLGFKAKKKAFISRFHWSSFKNFKKERR
jgi:hypothetical protein